MQETRKQHQPSAAHIEAIARCIFPDILAYYESEEGQQEFAQWKAEQEKLKTLIFLKERLRKFKLCLRICTNSYFCSPTGGIIPAKAFTILGVLVW